MPLDRPHWKTTGATSTLGCHWNHTGWCYNPVVFQWPSSVNLHNWNTLEDHWSQKYTGMPLEHDGRPLEIHWKTTGRSLEAHWLSPVAFQCTQGSKFQAHWIATGLPLEDHWLRVRATTWPGVWCYLWRCVWITVRGCLSGNDGYSNSVTCQNNHIAVPLL